MEQAASLKRVQAAPFSGTMFPRHEKTHVLDKLTTAFQIALSEPDETMARELAFNPRRAL
ncbi:MAG: hypothetical protein K2Y16_02335 [Burkholderiales bacterium]|nr:hypothetical protein [Burkholderiales bacterium]